MLDRDRIAQLHRDGKSPAEIATVFKTNRRAIMYHLRRILGGLTPDERARRLREGGRAGGQKAGITKRERRRRYLSGEMGHIQRREYERYMEKCRASARLGGWPTHLANRAEVAEARGETAQGNGKAKPPKPKHRKGGP